MSLKDHMGPKKDWTDEQWLHYSCIMVHSPWITESDREYWKDKIKELRK